MGSGNGLVPSILFYWVEYSELHMIMCQMDATESYLERVNIISGHDLVSSNSNPLPEPMLT